MKLRNISIISAGIIMLLLPVKASAFIIPKDLPTIEALIALHKAIKKDEDKALTRVATSYGEQSLIEKGAEKFNDVRTTLDTRLNNAYSYLVLAGAISSTANSLYQLVTEYKDFTGNTFSYVSKKPFVAGIMQMPTWHIKGDTALLQTVCIRSRFGYKPDEGLHG